MYHAQRWTPAKIKQRLNLITPLVYQRRTPLPAFRHTVLNGPLDHPPIAPGIDDSSWPVVQPHAYWGTWMQDFVLRTTFSIPAHWDPADPVALYLPLGVSGDFSHPEALAYVDGEPYGACDRHHQELQLSDRWRDGRPHTLALHGWTGLGGLASPEMEFSTQLFMHPGELVQIHVPTREFVKLARVAVETAGLLEARNPTQARLWNALDAAFLLLDTRDPLGEAGFYRSVPAALTALRAGLERAGPPLEVVVHASGHAHIDVAWLWTLGQTRRKAERTFATVLRLMEEFPDYHFSQSQPQLYEFIRQDQPALFAAIQQQIQAGRWEPMGGMWVEADCNLSGAESLARQFLLGRYYFREHFGPEAESPVLWLPDVFGYAWALPQLIRQAGLKYFMTIKIGWNQYNRLPYDTFLWQGLDGTQVLTHFSTVMELGSPYFSTYNSMANPSEALGAWSNFQQKELHADLLMAYGYGDGGGGPTREMLENLEVMERFPGLPQTRSSSVKAFFESIEPTVESRMMPVWNGELYLEYHRGTYTTQARNKRANRKSEGLLHDAELVAALATLHAGQPYPREAFTEAWRTICLNQFHDIIPGSSIGPVYEESQAQYAALTARIQTVRDAALQTLSEQWAAELLVVNPTSFVQRAPVFVAGAAGQAFERDGARLTTQPAQGGVWVDAGALAPYSLTVLQPISAGAAPETTPVPGPFVLENDCLRVEIDAQGDVRRIYDKQVGREVLAPAAVANQFQAFEDRPQNWDAWDVDIFYDDHLWLPEPATAVRWVEWGPLRQTLEIERQILSSRYVQRISLTAGSPRLDFQTQIQWVERHILLKVAFPVDILAPQATYDIQWGTVQRPTHRNTSWDWARFETCAHKWVDLSEGHYGVSLLNDCKYGHDVRDNVLRLTLLRSPTLPDPTADYGEHEFTYSLYPHAGSWGEPTQAAAYALNDPPWVYHSRPVDAPKRTGRPAPRPLVVPSAPNVVVETIKQAEDGDGYIVRLYESQRARGTYTLTFGGRVDAAWETNLLEENQLSLNVREGRELRLPLRPYQIVTLRVRLVPVE